MKQGKAGACKECTGIKISDSLWLCPHQAWGWASNLKGAEEEARLLVRAAGGYQKVLAAQEAAKRKKADNRRGKSGGH